VFAAVRSGFRFSGARELLSLVKAVNELRNTRVAHQEKPLTDGREAKAALVTWIEAQWRLWEAGKDSNDFG
jgi:hypothetical protein